jgi:hypothetical protein
MNTVEIQPRASLNEDYWWAYIEHAAIWRRFSPAQRGAILAMPVIGHRSIRGFSEPSLAEIERRPEIDKLLKSIDCDPKILRFHVLIRLMQVCHAAGDVFAPDRNPVELGHYLVRHVLASEAAREFNAKKTSGWYGHVSPFLGVELDLSRFASRSRLRSFLAIPPGEGGVRWESEQRQTSGSFNALSQFTGKVICGYAREILKRLVAAPGPLDLTGLIGDIRFDKKHASLVAKALRGLCQYVFTIAACDATCEGLVLGLWPGLKAHLAGPAAAPPPPPAAKAPSTTFVAPFLSADIAAVIVHAATKPLSLKQGAALDLYAAEERKLGALLEEVPSWIGGGMFQQRVRASVATFAAAGFGWLTMHRRELQFSTSKAGRDWLALPPAKRLETLLSQLRAARWDLVTPSFSGLPFSHVTGRIRRTASDHDILACDDGIAAAFRDVPTDAWTDTEAWLDHACRARNPIVATVGAETTVVIPKADDWRGIIWVKRDAESLEAEARTMLADFLFKRLIPIGGAELGRGHGKSTVFRLNEIGRYYIGATREFPTSGGAANGRVIVQPNFEIMILGSHLLAEADLAGICERTGAKSGAVFRVTRQSIQQALHQGATTDTILATLRRLSDRELPANVVTEIGGWSNSRKTFITRAATLLVCPDATVAARIRGLLPAATLPLNDTTLELTAPLTTPQRRKLEAAGIFKHGDGKSAGR